MSSRSATSDEALAGIRGAIEDGCQSFGPQLVLNLISDIAALRQDVARLEWSLIAREALSNERVARIRKKAAHEIERLKQFAPIQGQTHAG